MMRNLLHAAVAIIGVAASLSGCAPSVSLSDLSRPGYGMNPNPTVDLDAPYNSTSRYSISSQQPCLMSTYGCTPQLQLQWAETHLR